MAYVAKLTYPCQVDSLWAACSSDSFDAEVAEYIYAKARTLLPAAQILGLRYSMSLYMFIKIRLLTLLGVKLNPIDEFFLYWYQWSRLHSAVYEGRLPVCRWLLEKGLDPTTKDYHGRTPLMIAQEFGSVEICKLLEEHVEKRVEYKQKKMSILYQFCFFCTAPSLNVFYFFARSSHSLLFPLLFFLQGECACRNFN